jgi:hypothetical protein
MIDISVIKEQFSGLVGWRQNPDPTGHQLPEALTASSSGMYYNDVHAMLTMDNLLSICNDYDVTYVDQWIAEKTEAFILQAFHDWFYNKEKFGTAQGLMSYEVLFANPGEANKAQDIVLLQSGDQVGIEIETYKGVAVKYVAHSIALQFEQNADIDIKVQEVGQSDFVLEKTVAYTGNGNQQWHDINFVMYGHKKYKVYYVSNDPLNSAITSMRGLEMPYNTYYQVRGFKDDVYNYENYGIDLKISVSCDYTDLIVDMKDMFIDLISKRVAIGFLRELVYNPNARLNRHQNNVDDTQLLYEIDGDSQADPKNNNSLSKGYANAMRALSFDRSKIDALCLPCKRRGVRYTTTG